MAVKTAREATLALSKRILDRTGKALTYEDAKILRLAQKTLHRWAELECGDGNDYASWALERDEATGIPYMVTYPHKGEVTRRRVPDKEYNALKRVYQVCAMYELRYYHQTDPRGCSLYVSHARQSLKTTQTIPMGYLVVTKGERMQCECTDPGCWCRGLCPDDMTHYLYRVDMDDVGGVALCDLCGEDALDSGIFTDRPTANIDVWDIGEDD